MEQKNVKYEHLGHFMHEFFFCSEKLIYICIINQ